ncbi:MAG: CapA family protein [Lachnospiraceae bacterium]|nr:CapA family protein [Lachnospiraceae bacterium]
MSNTTSLIFTGDIGFDKYMEGRWSDRDLLAPSVASFLDSSDHIIVNVEGPLLDRSENPAGSDPAAVKVTGSAANLIHAMDPGVRHFLSGINADIWNICNNHRMDAGPEGMKSTLAYARECNAKTLGAGMDISEASSPVIISEAGSIGMIGVGYQRACRKADDTTPGCFSWSDLELIKTRISEIKKTCRWCVVVSHAGEEFTAVPSPYTRDRYISYLEMGADIVVAHHPHVVNNYELIGDKAIFYSLGNFIFDTDYQRSQFGTEFGVLLKLCFDEESFSFEPFGIKVDRENEQIVPCELPAIFCDIKEGEYEKLKALGAKVLIENTKRQLRYMKPQEFSNASEEDFRQNFYEPLRSGRVPGETLDMQIIYPLSQEWENDGWKSSVHKDVVEYMLAQINGK